MTEPASPPPLPSVLGLLRRAPGPFLGYTLLIGFGVCTTSCVFGIALMWAGSSGLLAHAVRTAGYTSASPGSVRSGFLALVLATMIAAAGGAAFAAPHENVALVLIVGTLAVAIVGGALAPLALAPVAAACGTPGIGPTIVRATDLAGADRLYVFAPLCAAIAVGLVAPIPLVAAGVFAILSGASFRPLIGLGIFAWLFWMAWVPTSAAMLTLRYLRHQQRNDAPTRIGAAMLPILVAAAIGLVALAGSAAVVIAGIAYLHRGVPSHAGLHEERLDFAVVGTRFYPHGGIVVVRGGEAEVLPRDLDDCLGYTRSAGGAIVTCRDHRGDPVWIEVDADGALVPSPLWDRVGIGPWSGGAAIFALLVLALALARIGRLGTSLRLLSNPRFVHAGTLRVEADVLTFASSEGAHLVRVPRAQIDHAREHALADGDGATLLANDALARMTFRTAHAPLPSDALIVIGPREDALARRIVRARKVGFRLGIVTLASLVVAAVALLLHA